MKQSHLYWMLKISLRAEFMERRIRATQVHLIYWNVLSGLRVLKTLAEAAAKLRRVGTNRSAFFSYGSRDFLLLANG